METKEVIKAAVDYTKMLIVDDEDREFSPDDICIAFIEGYKFAINSKDNKNFNIK